MYVTRSGRGGFPHTHKPSIHSFFIAKLLIQTFIHSFIHSFMPAVRCRCYCWWPKKGCCWWPKNGCSVVLGRYQVNLSRHQANLIDQGNLIDISTADIRKNLSRSGKPHRYQENLTGIWKNLSRHQVNLTDQGNLIDIRNS
jgi:hypothetical protein